MGDVVWAEPGTTHWHGADDGVMLVHLAVSHGRTVWAGEVGDDVYGRKGDGLAAAEGEGDGDGEK